MYSNGRHQRTRRMERTDHLERILVRLPKKRLLDMDNPIERYENPQFHSRFHLSKATALYITDLIKDDLCAVKRRGVYIPPILQFLIAQRYLCTNSFQLVIGDLTGVNLPQPSVCRIVKRVARAVAKLRKIFIRWPSEQEAHENRVGFYEIGGFPGVVGCVDGTQIQIPSPGGNDAELFRNRKQTFSINVQVICDHRLDFINVVARWYGSAHDMRIFENSCVSVDLEEKKIPGILLGDAGYSCLPYLMTPYPCPTTQPHKRYNKAQLKTRNCIERAIGCLKRRFPILSYCRLKLNTTLMVIVACAIIHNIARRRCDYFEENELAPYEEADNNSNASSTLNGRSKREEIIRNHFSS